jgi:hypothetical protein
MAIEPVKKVYSTHKVDKTEFIVDAVLVRGPLTVAAAVQLVQPESTD